MDPAEYAKMQEERAAMNKDFDLQRAQMIAEKVKETQEQAYIDETGATFLKAVLPPATPATATKPVLPPSIANPPIVESAPQANSPSVANAVQQVNPQNAESVNLKK